MERSTCWSSSRNTFIIFYARTCGWTLVRISIFRIMNSWWLWSLHFTCVTSGPAISDDYHYHYHHTGIRSCSLCIFWSVTNCGTVGVLIHSFFIANSANNNILFLLYTFMLLYYKTFLKICSKLQKLCNAGHHITPVYFVNTGAPGPCFTVGIGITQRFLF